MNSLSAAIAIRIFVACQAEGVQLAISGPFVESLAGISVQCGPLQRRRRFRRCPADRRFFARGFFARPRLREIGVNSRRRLKGPLLFVEPPHVEYLP